MVSVHGLFESSCSSSDLSAFLFSLIFEEFVFSSRYTRPIDRTRHTHGVRHRANDRSESWVHRAIDPTITRISCLSGARHREWYAFPWHWMRPEGSRDPRHYLTTVRATQQPNWLVEMNGGEWGMGKWMKMERSGRSNPSRTPPP